MDMGVLVCKADASGAPIEFVDGVSPDVRAFTSLSSFFEPGLYVLIPLSYHAIAYKTSSVFNMVIHSSKVVVVTEVNLSLEAVRNMVIQQVIKKGNKQQIGPVDLFQV